MGIRRPCRPGCAHLVTDQQPCPVHGRHIRPIDRARGNSNQRGYTYKWQQYTKRFLALHPLCAHCEQRGRITAATLVDHIIPVQSANDPNFWKADNHSPLCPSCHALKTIEDQRQCLTRKTS